MPEIAPAWTAPYAGIPFRHHGRDHAAIDCWGLVLLVLREQFGVCGPDFSYRMVEHPDDIPSVAQVFYDGKQADWWTPVPAGEEQPGDVILMNEGGVPRHCGIVVAPGIMLHAIYPVGSCLDGYRRPHRRSSIEGFYRYCGSPSA